MQVRNVVLGIALWGASVSAPAQWINQPTPGTPRTKDGKPILTAPAPRREGKPDLSGVWEVESSPRKEVEKMLAPRRRKRLRRRRPLQIFPEFFLRLSLPP